MVDDDELDHAPDVMILPSKLKQFSKVGSSSVIIMSEKLIYTERLFIPHMQ